MKIIQLAQAQTGTMLVWENGRKVPVLCFALIEDEVDGPNDIYPCICVQNTIAPYIKGDARVVL